MKHKTTKLLKYLTQITIISFLFFFPLSAAASLINVHIYTGKITPPNTSNLYMINNQLPWGYDIQKPVASNTTYTLVLRIQVGDSVVNYTYDLNITCKSDDKKYCPQSDVGATIKEIKKEGGQIEMSVDPVLSIQEGQVMIAFNTSIKQ